MTACPHGMPTPKACVQCMDEGLLPPEPQPRWHRVFGFRDWKAKHSGTCAICDGEIMVGNTITRVERGTEERYAHARCLPGENP